MLRQMSLIAVVLATTMAVAIGSASAKDQAQERRVLPVSTGMRVVGESSSPGAFADFCRRTAKECEPDATAPSRAALTPQLWSELNDINDTVNQTVIARSDLDVYGVVDYWTIAGKYGDCEDYALTKQLMLRQRGWPMNALLITVVRDENGEGHAILTVRTSRGDLVLDNRQPRIVAWTATPYQFIKRQSTSNPRIWMALDSSVARPIDAYVAALALPVRKR